MQLYITSLNSGSNGNCYYIGNETEAVLVDAGLSCSETEIRMQRLGLTMDKVVAIFISHEHSDHIKGVEVLSRKYRLPVFITVKTLQNLRLNLSPDLVNEFLAYEPIQLGGLNVTAFPKFHDAKDPHSFIIGNGQTNVGVFTDIGTPCQDVIQCFRQCHAVFLETNYDEQMLEFGHYPLRLKKRISGKRGHLSNRQALDLFKTHKPDFMRLVLLSHLSRDNNDPQFVQELFMAHARGAEIAVASRLAETPIYAISALPGDMPSKEVTPLKEIAKSKLRKSVNVDPNQMTLDF